jgi:predicted ATP-dependent serine protease
MYALITESLKRKQIKFLGRFTRDFLSKTESTWLQWIFDYNIKYGQPPSLDRFCNEFSASFVQVDSVDPLADLFEQTVTEKKNWIVRQYIQSHAEELREGADPSALIEDLHKKISLSQEDVFDSKDFDVSLYFEEVVRIFTGIETVDFATGGINDGDLVYVVGRPQDGKTTFLLHMIARWFWEGKNILVISNEIPALDMSFKIDAILTGVPVGEKRSGKFQEQSKEKLRFLRYLKSVAPNRLIIPNHPVRKPSAVLALIQEHKPDIVCIDGVYLMSTTNSPSVEWTELAAVSRELKMIANQAGTPVIGVIQANRGASEKQIVGGENIAGTDAFFQDPDIVLSLRHVLNSGNNRQKTVTLSTTKNRHGYFATCEVNYDFETMTLREES